MFGFLVRHVGALVKENLRFYFLVRAWFYLLVFVFRKPHEPEFAVLRRLGGKEGDLLDVGANDGLSAYSMRVFDKNARIICIEPDPHHERNLRRTQRHLGNLIYQLCAAGEASGKAVLYSPVYNGLAMTSCASLVEAEARDLPKQSLFTRSFDPDRLQVRRLDVDVVRIDDMDVAPYFVKIDVQGSELAVLKGMVETIRVHRPVIMVEKGVSLVEVRNFLFEFGYGVVDPQSAEPVDLVDVDAYFNVVYWPFELDAP